jgi:uncharacterized protein GlcG (DUF336 family)
MTLTLPTAQSLVDAALAEARRQNYRPLAVVVLDARGSLKAAAAEDGTSLKRFEIAHGKAFGALSLGLGSRALAKRATEQPSFIAAVTHVVGGSLVPVPGGVLLRDGSGAIVGVAGASGDLSENDEAALLAGIAATDLVGDTGA